MTKEKSSRRRRSSWLPAYLAGAASVAAYVVAIRPAILSWGANEREKNKPYPGDEFIPRPRWTYTHAVTVHAPVRLIWPWLVQWGYGRGGFYSYDFIDEAVGAKGTKSADRILPEFQDLKVGDTVKIFDEGGFIVRAMEPEKYLVLHGRLNLETNQGNQFDEPMPEKFMESTLGWFLEPLNGEYTRLISHSNMNYSPQLQNEIAYGEPMKIGSFVMDRGMLEGIKKRAEALYQQENSQSG